MRCKHPLQTHWRDENDRLVKARCAACLSWLSLGPSNDEPEAVRIEMRAAEIAANLGRALRDGELFGWRSFGMGVFPYPGEAAGYLARAIAEHEEG